MLWLRCDYVNCEREAEVIVVFDGKAYHLCRHHMSRLIRSLERNAKGRTASLRDFQVKRERGKIRVYISSSSS